MSNYVFQNKNGVTAVLGKARIDEPKEIRFVYPDYQEKFRISDGDQIIVIYPTGERKAFVCQYIDDYHLLVGHNAFHICEYAECLQRLGAHIYPFPEKRIIWSNVDLNLEDWIVDLKADYPGLTEDEYYAMMVNINSQYLNDERENLNIQCGSDIIAIADLGRWNGRFSGYEVITSGRISDCLSSPYDYAEWYVDREGEFRSRQIHHDATNYLYYRRFRDDVSEDERRNLLASIYDEKATQVQIDRVTEKLGETIGKVYGWEFPTEHKDREQARDAR